VEEPPEGDDDDSGDSSMSERLRDKVAVVTGADHRRMPKGRFRLGKDHSSE
jgi:hypothetical protein